MGQYYFPLLIDEDENKIYRAYSHDFDNGLKLMEHSWVGNDFVNAVLGMLYGKAMRLAWIGDYANDVVFPDTVFSDGFIRGKRAFTSRHRIAMNGGDHSINLNPETAVPLDFNLENPEWYVINETKGVFLDLARYIEGSVQKGWCINPIPLLTSVGNGQGGGDYGGEDEHLVGSWAFDKLRITGICPGKYKEFTPPVFQEKRYDEDDVPFS